MNDFEYHANELYCEEVPVEKIAAEVGTPFYLYSASTLKHHYRIFEKAFDEVSHLICFSVKVNSNLAVLQLMASLGAGADIVSGGELFRTLKAGIPAGKTVFSGVGKRYDEIRAALEAGILMFNVESEEELNAINRISADMGQRAPIAIRINPDVDPKTHPYISTGMKKNKFGIPVTEALHLYRSASTMKSIRVVGVDFHIGSQLTTSEPFGEAVEKLMELVRLMEKEGIHVTYVDVGGGLGIVYDNEDPPLPSEYARTIIQAMGGSEKILIIEPGRVIAGNAGILVTQVIYTKKTPAKNFTIVDASMTDLIRPTLYGAYQEIIPAKKSSRREIVVDVVGPVCESSDFLACDRRMPAVAPGELLAVMSAGAYGFTMASQYNSRPRAAEVMVDGSHFEVIRERESFEDLIRGERFFRG